MFSSCTALCLLRKKVSHTWKQICVSSENEKHVKRIFSERVIPSKEYNSLLRAKYIRTVLDSALLQGRKDNILPFQVFGHVGEPHNGSTDRRACPLPAGRQSQLGSTQCISEIKDTIF